MASQWTQLKFQKYGVFLQLIHCSFSRGRCLLSPDKHMTHCRSCLPNCLLASWVSHGRKSAVTAVKRSPKVVSWVLLFISFVFYTPMNLLDRFSKS
jgi:hypothetical protein